MSLIDRIVELGISVGDLLAVDKELEALHQALRRAVFFGQRRHFDRVISDIGGLDQMILHLFAEEFVDQLAFAHRFVDLDVKFLAQVAQRLFVHAADIDPRVSFDGLEHGQPLVWPREIDLAIAHLHHGAAGHFARHAFEALLHHFHHPDVVLIGHVDLHRGELGIVRAVHALVAEHFAELIHPVESTHDQALEIQLVGDAQV